MCGIIGYTGQMDAKKVLTEGLQELEYRGYDSAGIAYFKGDVIKTLKREGKVSFLCDALESEAKDDETTCGIGHTRWATHGGVSTINSHPHTYGKVTLIHNGIIENYKKLEEEFREKGQEPVSQTDSEIAAMVLNDCYDGNPVKAIKSAIARLEGAYAFCIMFEEYPGVIYAIRQGSPLVAASTSKGSMIASDVVALIKYTKDYFILPENHIARMTKDEIIVTNMEHQVVEPKILHVNWDIASARKGGYEYFMLKEIHEQPEALKKTIGPRVVEDLPDFSKDCIPDSLFTDVNRVVITACGTAMHAGLIGKN